MSNHYHDAETHTLQDVPTAKRTNITATIVSTRWEENYSHPDGPALLKMLVLCEGDAGRFKLWGSCPAAIQESINQTRSDGDTRASIKGSLIQFSAQVGQSKNDPKFGFFKRPTKARVLVPGANGRERS